MAMVGALDAVVSQYLRGISVISQEAPIFQELTKVSAVVAGGMVGVASLGNAVGPRLLGMGFSDLITRRATFFVMFFLVQVLLFWFLPRYSTRTALSAGL